MEKCCPNPNNSSMYGNLGTFFGIFEVMAVNSRLRLAKKINTNGVIVKVIRDIIPIFFSVIKRF
jgi:hypothetical protein